MLSFFYKQGVYFIRRFWKLLKKLEQYVFVVPKDKDGNNVKYALTCVMGEKIYNITFEQLNDWGVHYGFVSSKT